MITFTGQNTPPFGNVEGAIVAGSRNYVNTYDYDANGNMITRSLPGGPTWTYVYDEANRLESVSGVVSATFTYDGDGNRVKGIAGGVTTYYVGNYYEYLSGGTVKKYYYHAGKRVAMYNGGTLNWLLGEHLGSTTITANSSGMRTGEIRYKAYGASRYTYGTTPTTYHFTGQREEGAIGLYYYGARWYDPALGRFVQADSIIPNGAYPQDFNRYAYTRNNPVKFIDSSGHWVESALDIAGIAWDIYDIKQEGLNWKTGGALALDIAFLILPIATGGGAIVRGISHADEVGGAARAVARLDDVGDTGKALDALADTAKTLDKADDAAGSAKVAAKGTRSPGRLGGPAHQAKVADIQTDMKLRKLDVKTEFHVKTPGGEKGARFIDVAGIDRSTGKVVEFHQVGQATRAGRPVARERRAIEDIKRFGGQYSDISIAFHEY